MQISPDLVDNHISYTFPSKFICLFGFFCLSREFFTHTETSPSPVKGCKCWRILGTHVQWAVRVLKRATPSVSINICLLWSSPRTRETHTCCRTFVRGAVTTCSNALGLSRLGFEHLTFRMRWVPSIGQNWLPFTGNGDVSIWVKNSWVGRQTPNKQTNKNSQHVFKFKGY